MIECTSFYGENLLLPEERFALRPSAYAIIGHNGKILLVTNRRSGKFYFPGGGIEEWERVTDGLKREVMEETGIEIGGEKLVHFEEDFLYYDPLDKAFHALLFYYSCEPKTMELSNGDHAEDGEGDPRWVNIQSLDAQSFHNHGELLLRLLHTVFDNN